MLKKRTTTLATTVLGNSPKQNAEFVWCMEEVLEVYQTAYNPRIPVITEVRAWQDDHNHEETWIDWRFTTADARVKLHRLYPSVNH